MINLNTVTPLTFNKFRDYYKNYNNYNELQSLYSQYILDYKNNKAALTISDNNFISDNYKEFIKNVDNDDINVEVKTFLNELDYNDPYELDIAAHYVSDNLKREFSRLKDYRDELKFVKTKNNLKASPAGLKIYLTNFLSRLLRQDSFIKGNTNVTSINIKELINKLSIKFIQYSSNDITRSDNSIDVNDFNTLDFSEKIKKESKKTIQGLNITSKGKKYLLSTNIGKKISINKLFTNPLRLPERFFANEVKSIENLNISLKEKLSEKYLNTDVYYLSGDTFQYGLKRILTAENSNSYINRYNPTAVNNYGTLIKSDKLPYQLSFNNSGLAQALSKNLTFNINVSAVAGEYIIPDPNKVQPGIGIRKGVDKKSTPINFVSDNFWIKNNDRDSIKVADTDTLKSYGYQSKESSLKYNSTGINRSHDEISFWTGSQQNIWKNEDVYKRHNLNEYPENERLEDLLIKNETAVVLKNDIYGNEFIFYKSVSPKRYADTSFTLYNTTNTLTADTTACELYDGLYFNSVLSAISADGNYSSLTGMYDTVLTNDISSCLGSGGFFAPLSTANCSAVSGNDLVDCYLFSGHPCDGSHFTAMYFEKYNINSFINVSIPSGFTTTYELTSLDNPSLSTVPLYEQKYINTGSLFVRDISSQKVSTFYDKLSGVFSKISATAKNAISSNEVVNFDIIGNTMYIQTSANTFTESYTYDGSTFKVALPSNSII
tara:strand:- start:6785 stop:8941 length:2157 start_codon:yes stop_codon:yes gene_type:complete